MLENDGVKRAVYNEFLQKVNAIQTIDTNDLVKKAGRSTTIYEIEKKCLIMINILLLNNLISFQLQNLMNNLKKQD